MKNNFRYPVKFEVERQAGAATAFICFDGWTDGATSYLGAVVTETYAGGTIVTTTNHTAAIQVNVGDCAEPDVNVEYSPGLEPGQTAGAWKVAHGPYLSTETEYTNAVSHADIAQAARDNIIWGAVTSTANDYVTSLAWAQAAVNTAYSISRSETLPSTTVDITVTRLRARHAQNSMQHIDSFIIWTGGAMAIPGDGSWSDWVTPATAGTLAIKFGIGPYNPPP